MAKMYILFGYFLIVFIIASMLSACSTKVMYKEVKIPIRCDIPDRERPNITPKATVVSIKAILIYTEKLENDLNFCKTGRFVLPQ